MGFYSYAGLVLSSIFPLKELQIATEVDPDITFRLLSAPAPEPETRDWLQQWRAERNCESLALAKTANGFLLRFRALADFSINNVGDWIGVWPASVTTSETIRHLLLDQVLPRVLALRHWIVFHASAVRVGDRAIAFTGETGSGKSTLVASFRIAGYPLLSDDSLVVTPGNGAALALPTYQSLRLWPETISAIFAELPRLECMAHYSSKQRVLLDPTAEIRQQQLPLAALYVLAPEKEGEPPEISSTRLSPRDACLAIIHNTFQFDLTDCGRAADLLAKAGKIAQHLPTFRLTLARDYTCLPDVRTCIMSQHGCWARGVVGAPAQA